VPTIKSILYIGLSARDARRSADWWQQLPGMEVEKENFNQEHWPAPWNEVQLIHAQSGFQLGFIEHPQNSGEQFSEFGTGLDHIEFEVSSHEELEQWRDRLDAMGIPHSGIKEAPHRGQRPRQHPVRVLSTVVLAITFARPGACGRSTLRCSGFGPASGR
jgi:catechol 2,3-dioxygenase-like lactoylglutathione lyase family enzyme